MKNIGSLRRSAVAIVALVAFLLQGTWALAGTTGSLSGTVTDQKGASISGATVQVVAPSGSSKTTTDGSGHFAFLTLAPDTYTVTAKKDGFQLEQVPGVTVIVDQTRSVDIRMQSSLKTIAHVAVRATGGLVRSGVVSDVYSINAVQQKAAAPLGGAGALNQAYGAIASAPGVNYDQGQQG